MSGRYGWAEHALSRSNLMVAAPDELELVIAISVRNFSLRGKWLSRPKFSVILDFLRIWSKFRQTQLNYVKISNNFGQKVPKILIFFWDFCSTEMIEIPEISDGIKIENPGWSSATAYSLRLCTTQDADGLESGDASGDATCRRRRCPRLWHKVGALWAAARGQQLGLRRDHRRRPAAAVKTK